MANGHAALVGDVESELDLRGVPAAARGAAVRPSESDGIAAWAHMPQAEESLGRKQAVENQSIRSGYSGGVPLLT
jgi:hypothetical protein